MNSGGGEPVFETFFPELFSFQKNNCTYKVTSVGINQT